MKTKNILMLLLAVTVFVSACKKNDDNTNNNPASTEQAKDPNTAPKVSVDRFSDAAGMLQRRSASPSLPAANAPVNFDVAPFITAGFSPTGAVVEYYNFDVQPIIAAPIYVLYKDGQNTPVANQLNIINVIPGDAGYNDFWQVYKVTVPASYEANVVTSYSQIIEKGYTITPTTMVVNCPVVPEGSTATKRIGGGNAGLIHGWYKNQVVAYFSFEEKALELERGAVPTSPIYVTFNKNPDANDATSGPASGFKAEGNGQTHNVVKTLPADAAYSPLWSVSVYDNADFANVTNLTTAQSAKILANGVANVNCPIATIK
jgi:hypothetical protein